MRDFAVLVTSIFELGIFQDEDVIFPCSEKPFLIVVGAFGGPIGSGCATGKGIPLQMTPLYSGIFKSTEEDFYSVEQHHEKITSKRNTHKNHHRPSKT